MTQGFDLDEIERLLAAATVGDWWNEGCGIFYAPNGWLRTLIYDEGGHTEDDAALIVTLKRSAPAMIAAIRELRAEVERWHTAYEIAHDQATENGAQLSELRAENARLRHHWSALDKALTDNIIETDQPHRVRWEGEWHYGPLADAYFAMTSVVRKLARAALGEPQ